MMVLNAAALIPVPPATMRAVSRASPLQITAVHPAGPGIATPTPARTVPPFVPPATLKAASPVPLQATTAVPPADSSTVAQPVMTALQTVQPAVQLVALHAQAPLTAALQEDTLSKLSVSPVPPIAPPVIMQDALHVLQ